MSQRTESPGLRVVAGETAPLSRGGALDTLRPMAAVASAIMVGFIFYNLVDFPPGIRETVIAHDAFSAIFCGMVWWGIQAGRFRESQAHPLALAMILLLASNVLLAMWLLRAPYQAIYICVVLVGAGGGMTSVRWGSAVVALLWLITAPVLLAVADLSLALRYLVMVAATSAVTMALIVLRARNLRALAKFAELDRQQRRALNEAVADLDAKVAQRTAELQEANAALQLEMEERARAEREARILGEQLLHAQRLESLGRLAGGVAHDFNNLLTVIDGNLHLSLDAFPDEAHRVLLLDAISAGERAASLTKQLLAFGRKQVIERSVFDVGTHVEDVSRMLQRVLGERIELIVTAHERGLWVNADPNQIEQILMNLVANARDAMPDGGRCLIEVTRVPDATTSRVRIRVRDTGLGMDDAVKERIFEPFFTTKPSGQGTGLGLATAYGVVQQHGGSIAVESRPGHGATFDVLLPAADAPASSTGISAAPWPRTGGHETVLLVEDEEAVRRVGERFLRRQGYNVLVASGGAEALQLVAQADPKPDLLFTDVMMPGMSGFELAEKLRVMQPEIRIMFVSGYTGDYLETQTGSLPSGAHFVYKPYEPKRTARMIRELLDGQSEL